MNKIVKTTAAVLLAALLTFLSALPAVLAASVTNVPNSSDRLPENDFNSGESNQSPGMDGTGEVPGAENSGNVDQGSDGEIGSGDSAPSSDGGSQTAAPTGTAAQTGTAAPTGTAAADDDGTRGGVVAAIIAIVVVVAVILIVIALMPKKRV